MLIGGLFAYPIEGFWRLQSNGGWVCIWMLFVYGLCFFAIGNINQMSRFYKLSMRWQAFIGVIIILIIELFFGLLLNVWLNLNIWDYSNLKWHIYGQISLIFGVFWFFLVPFGIWLEDKLNYIWEKAHGREALYNYTLWQAYKELFIF